MKAIPGFIKVKQFGQSQAGAGWNKHVNKFQKRIGNKVIRRVARDEIQRPND
ncbi:MAG TPA: hypothetical protein VI759_09700 [Dehalococcoidia bacterium]|nr:hypothetical protein [Dehalococcoidia bacterium]